MTFFENLSGFLFSPRVHITSLLQKGISEEFIRTSRRFSHFSWIYGGILLNFLYLYPELYFYPESWPLIGNTPLYVGILSQPYFLLAIFAASFGVVYLLNRLHFGTLNYKIGLKLVHKNQCNSNLTVSSEDREITNRITKPQYLALFSYTVCPFYFWSMFGVIRLYFWEKIQINQAFFPFMLWSSLNILFFGFLLGCLIWKWWIQIKIAQLAFHIPFKQAVFSPLLEVLYYGGIFALMEIIGLITLAIYQ